jgi:SAM-dependent methyltransferase
LSSAERIKQVYERFPYPGNDLAALLRRGGSMPALKWMQGIGRPGSSAPRRVLVAGCGTGVEAFVLRRQLPKADIVAVDFSPRSIAVARKLERKANVGRPITFLVADLTDAALRKKIGGDFDLITCHGVLSYIPAPARALRALATCLAPGGALYLGVNGAGHPTTTLRPWLQSFGIDVSELKAERRLRTLLQLWDALHDDDLGELSTMPTSYLAGDVCGAFFNNGSLAYWRTVVRRSGWAVAGTAILPPALRLVMDGGRERPLYPAEPGDVAARLDAVRPAGFHRLMLRRVEPRNTAWIWTGLYTVRFEARTAHFFSATLGVRFEDELTAPQLAALKLWATKKGATEGGERRWTRSEKGRRLWWRWICLGVVAAGNC